MGACTYITLLDSLLACCACVSATLPAALRYSNDFGGGFGPALQLIILLRVLQRFCWLSWEVVMQLMPCHANSIAKGFRANNTRPPLWYHGGISRQLCPLKA